MCPATTHAQPDINMYWSDEELCLSLYNMTHGFPLPSNVIADVNPFQHMPSNLPDDIWYLLCPEVKKDVEFGFWKAKGDACLIFTNTSINGWRTTFEFYEGKALDGRKTSWLMQEYRLTKEMHENSKDKVPSTLCRFFLTTEGNLSNIVSEEIGGTGQGSTSKSQMKDGVNEANPVPETERLLNHPEEDHLEENLQERDLFSSGDFLELLDLEDPMSPSSSSENSSCISMTSDQCFESMHCDLESEDKRTQNGKNGSCKFNILASERPKEVVICPPTAGSLIHGIQNMPPTQTPKMDLSLALPTEENFCEGGQSSKSPDKSSSSSDHIAVTGREKKQAGKRKGKPKKYFCFIPL